MTEPFMIGECWEWYPAFNLATIDFICYFKLLNIFEMPKMISITQAQSSKGLLLTQEGGSWFDWRYFDRLTASVAGIAEGGEFLHYRSIEL